MSDASHHNRDAIRISWRWVASASALLGAGSLATLIIVATTKKADPLASIALIVAILAFLIQIVVFIIDSFSSSRRDREASELNASTQALLSKIDERTSATNVVLNEQFSKIIDRVLFSVKAAVTEPDGDFENRKDVLDEVQRALSSAQRDYSNEPLRSSNSYRSLELELNGPLLRIWPAPQQLVDLVSVGLATLGDPARQVLKRLALDADLSFERRVMDGFPVDGRSQAIVELARARLIDFRESPDSDYIHLTGLGFAAARLFLAPPPIPPEVSKSIPWLSAERSTDP